MWSKSSRVVYIDTRWLFLKVLVFILAVAAVITYWNWTRVTEIKFTSKELEANWRITHPEAIRQICSGLKKCKSITGYHYPANGIEMSIYSRKEVRTYLWDGSDYLFDNKTANVIGLNINLKRYLELAAREIKNRSPFGEIVDWKEVKSVFKVGSRAVITDLDSGITFTVCRTGGYSHADVEPLSREDTIKLNALYNGKINWKRRAVIVQITGKKFAASLTGAPHGHGKINSNDLYGKVGIYFSDKGNKSGISISHKMMIWKAAGRTSWYLRKMNPEEIIIAIFTAIDQQDLKSLKLLLKHPEELKGTELKQIIGFTVTGMRKETLLNYDVTVSVSLKKGPYNHKRHIRLKLLKDDQNGYYVADNDFWETIFSPV